MSAPLSAPWKKWGGGGGGGGPSLSLIQVQFSAYCKELIYHHHVYFLCFFWRLGKRVFQYVHVMMFTQITQIAVQFLDAFLVRLDTFALESFIELNFFFWLADQVFQSVFMGRFFLLSFLFFWFERKKKKKKILLSSVSVPHVSFPPPSCLPPRPHFCLPRYA